MSTLYTFEKKLWDEGYQRIMGLDEVGRGCLAGPVVAAGVVFEQGIEIAGINDSKQLSLAEREMLAKEIKETALFCAIEQCNVDEIGELNILWASLRAMEKCVERASPEPDYLLVDGNRYPATIIPHSKIVKGDSKSASIAAASILAKVHRDLLMKKLHQSYPHFGWDTNVGYPTKKHYQGLQKYGYTPHHRTTFSLKTEMKYQSKGKYQE